MAITLIELRRTENVEKIVIHSLDLSLYQASVVINGEEQFVTDNMGKLIRSFSILDFQKMFRGINYAKMTLRQSSAYDEMIGHTSSAGLNTMEVLIQDNFLS